MAHQHDESWRKLSLDGGAAAAAGEVVKRQSGAAWKAQVVAGRTKCDRTGLAASAAAGADRWAEEQLFEEDVRAVLTLMRPNRRERILGWSEYRTGGAHFRATVSWDEDFESTDAGRGLTRIPNMTDVLEAILVGSARHDDELTAAEEFEIYRGVVRELHRRLDDLQACYE